MSTKLLQLQSALESILGSEILKLESALGELTVELTHENYFSVLKTLRTHEAFQFDQLVDLTGVDYGTYANETWTGPQFAVVVHLLSLEKNWRLRVRCFALDNSFPVLPTLMPIWESVNWFEREAFDLVGIHFDGHPDMRRILTDYGFVGHPLRKSFPVSGHVEMRYDAQAGRVIYQPITIEPRENVPRVVREARYGDVGHV